MDEKTTQLLITKKRGEILVEFGNYNDAVLSNAGLSETNKIQLKIKELRKELKVLLYDNTTKKNADWNDSFLLNRAKTLED